MGVTHLQAICPAVALFLCLISLPGNSQAKTQKAAEGSKATNHGNIAAGARKSDGAVPPAASLQPAGGAKSAAATQSGTGGGLGTQAAKNGTATSKTNTPPCCKKPSPPLAAPEAAAQKPTFVSYPKDLPKCVDPTKFATDFDKIFPGVNAIKRAGMEKVLFLLDSTPDKYGKAPDLTGVKKEIEDVVGSLEENCSGIGVAYFVYPREQKHSKECPRAAPSDWNAAISYYERTSKCEDREDYAARPVPASSTLDQWKAAVPGVAAILPASDGRFLFVIKRTPDPGDPSGSRNIADVEKQIREVVDDEYLEVSEPFVVSLPPGINNAGTIAKLLDGRVHNASIIASDNTRLLITPTQGDAGKDPEENLKYEIQGLVSDLAVPEKGYSPDVTGQLTRLFYLRDNSAAAALLNNALPDVTAAPVGNDSIMLSTAVAGAEETSRGPGYGDEQRNRKALKAGRRLIAQMDQPHAQVSLFAWSLQLSEKEPNDARTRWREAKTDKRLQLIHSISTVFNELVTQAVNAGWQFLREKINQAGPSYFDAVFGSYLRSRVTVISPPAISGNSQSGLPTVTSCCGGNSTPSPLPLHYALGYDKLFSDLSPNLMNMLLVVSASANPLRTANCLINRMEQNGPQGGSTSPDDCNWTPLQGSRDSSWQASCQASDEAQYSAQQNRPEDKKGFQMECTRMLLRNLFAATGNSGPNSLLGRFRAAVADFLFHYKLMIEYPNDFDSYLEPASAAKLDAQLVEFVDAFESDLAVLNYGLRDEVARALGDPGKRTESYDYSGIVSIKVVAGDPALVESQAQNYFPATPPNTLADFANALSKAEQNQPKILTGNLSADAATGALALLAQVSPTKQTVSIGRELDMSVTPYTLSAANGAELDVEITAKDNGATVVGAATTGTSTKVDDLSSRVSNHHIKSHVRLQSLKLFELSSLDSTLARGKTPWKLVDPYLEIPVFGGLVSVPRHPDLIRQRSVVFLSAVVVPTAADLAATPLDEDTYGFQTQSTGRPLHTISPDLLGKVEAYHRRVIDCLSAATTDADGNVSGCRSSKDIQ
jgi:hypothetical protein